MKRSKTYRGFKIINFKDIYDEPCSIQESSLAAKAAIWVGTDNPTPPSRMHVDQKLAKKLVKILQTFIETGAL